MPSVFDNEPQLPVRTVLSVVPSEYHDAYYQPKLKGVCVHCGIDSDLGQDPRIWTQFFDDATGKWTSGTETGRLLPLASNVVR